MRGHGNGAGDAGESPPIPVLIGASDRSSYDCGLPILALAVAAIVACFTLPLPGEDNVSLYQRSTAAQDACKAAAAEISAARGERATAFADNCKAPVVTAIWNHPGHVIVTRVVEAPAGSGKDERQVYSVRMNGSGHDLWRFLELKVAPNMLVLDASQLSMKPRAEAAETPK